MDADAEREELLNHLFERFGEAAVREAATRQELFTIAVELTDPRAPLLSARELADAAGIPLETVEVLRASLGFPVRDPDEATIPDTSIEDFVLAQFAIETFGRERTLAFTRVLGAAAQQIAEAGRALFAYSVVDDGTTRPTQLELSQHNELAWTAWRALPTVIDHTLVELGDSVQHIVTELLDGDVMRAVGFVDLVGSTAWTLSADAQTQTAALIRFEQGAWEAATRHGGRLVKLIGDEAMFSAHDPSAALRIAADMLAFAANDPDLPDARAGLAFGPVVARAGDYFGPVVNLAARIVGVASPGSIVAPRDLVTTAVVDQLAVTDLGNVELRGLPDPVPLIQLAADLRSATSG